MQAVQHVTGAHEGGHEGLMGEEVEDEIEVQDIPEEELSPGKPNSLRVRMESLETGETLRTKQIHELQDSLHQLVALIKTADDFDQVQNAVSGFELEHRTEPNDGN